MAKGWSPLPSYKEFFTVNILQDGFLVKTVLFANNAKMLRCVFPAKQFSIHLQDIFILLGTRLLWKNFKWEVRRFLVGRIVIRVNCTKYKIANLDLKHGRQICAFFGKFRNKMGKFEHVQRNSQQKSLREGWVP